MDYECNLALKIELEKLWEEGERKICLDLSKTDFVGSLTIGLLSFAQNHLDDIGGKFCLINSKKSTKEILKIMGITKTIRIIEDEKDLD